MRLFRVGYEAYGFGGKWINLINTCISTAKLSVLINESPSKEFFIGRGIRQGNPLTPFLILVGIEGLFVLFQRAATTNLFKGIHLETTFASVICNMQTTL